METKVVFKNEYPELIQSPQFKEDIVKNHIEIIVLSLLSEKPMSGYDIIKEIFTKYNVLIRQGTIYSLLDALKNEGILHAEFTKGDMRTKRYSPTQEGKRIIEKKINESIEAEQYFLNSIMKRELYV